MAIAGIYPKYSLENRRRQRAYMLKLQKSKIIFLFLEKLNVVKEKLLLFLFYFRTECCQEKLLFSYFYFHNKIHITRVLSYLALFFANTF